MNKYGKSIDENTIGKLELIILMIDTLTDDVSDAHLKDDLIKASTLIFNHANIDSEFFND